MTFIPGFTDNPNVATGPAQGPVGPGETPLPGMPNPAAPTTAAFHPGAAVAASKTRQLQQWLNSRGAGLVVDGIYGPKTAAAVARFGTPDAPRAPAGAPAQAPAAGGGAPAAGGAPGAAPAPSTNTPPTDPNQIDALIRSTYGYEAWMLDIPELKTIIENAVSQGWFSDTARLQGALMATNWWKTTSQTQRQYTELAANNPEELNFANPGSQASKMYQDLMALAASEGLQLDASNPGALQAVALDAMRYGWDTQMQKQQLSQFVTYGGPNAGQTNVGALAQQLQGISGSYLMPPDTNNMNTWMKQIVGGTATTDSFKAAMQMAAQSKYPWAAPMLEQGQTMEQIVSPYRQDAASLMETSPNNIDFVNDPTYQRVLDYVAPGDTQHRMMTMSEMNTYLRGTSQWGYTQQARDSVGTWENNILKTWGVIA